MNFEFLLFTVAPSSFFLDHLFSPVVGMLKGSGNGPTTEREGEKNLSSSKEDFAELDVVVLFEETE